MAGHRARILIVEDDRAFAELLADLLELEGYHVQRARDGEEALRILRAGDPPNLVVSDVMMPKLSGIELVAAAREVYPPEHLPFLLLSASHEPALVAEGVWFLGKPLDFDDLLELVGALVAGRQPEIAGYDGAVSRA